MANTRSAAKQARAAVRRRRRARNRTQLSTVRTSEKKIRSLAKAGNTEEAGKLISQFQSQIDRAAKKGVLHKNTASRHKQADRRAAEAGGRRRDGILIFRAPSHCASSLRTQGFRPASRLLSYWHPQNALLPLCGLQIARLIRLFTVFYVTCAVAFAPSARAQNLPVSTIPPKSSAGEAPVVITADGQNTYLGDIATADDNVVVKYKEDTIYADHVIFDRSTKVLIANGNVRLFSGTRLYRGESFTYNLDTKAMESSSFLGEEYPKLLSAKHVTTPEINHYRLTNATFSTSNREVPSFHLAASTVEYRPNDEVVLKNVLLYIGEVPVFYFPIFVQSLVDTRPAYQFEVGAGGQFGAFLENKYNFVVDNNLRGTVEFDVREKRGYAGGGRRAVFPGRH